MTKLRPNRYRKLCDKKPLPEYRLALPKLSVEEERRYDDLMN